MRKHKHFTLNSVRSVQKPVTGEASGIIEKSMCDLCVM